MFSLWPFNRCIRERKGYICHAKLGRVCQCGRGGEFVQADVMLPPVVTATLKEYGKPVTARLLHESESIIEFTHGSNAYGAEKGRNV